jgi:hypothetical protein
LFTQEIFKNGLAFKQHIELAKQTGKLQWTTKLKKC